VKLKFSQKYFRQYAKLRPKEQLAVKIALDIYVVDPRDSRLKWHRLKRANPYKCSITAKWDLRIILFEFLEENVTLVDKVGSHSKVY
jgi:mRNA-degrading endonuclease YafQ of YafQ-DinJ toxin-antitoxin module